MLLCAKQAPRNQTAFPLSIQHLFWEAGGNKTAFRVARVRCNLKDHLGTGGWAVQNISGEENSERGMFLCGRQDRQDLARSSTSFMGRAAAGGAEWKKVSQEKLQLGNLENILLADLLRG